MHQHSKSLKLEEDTSSSLMHLPLHPLPQRGAFPRNTTNSRTTRTKSTSPAESSVMCIPTIIPTKNNTVSFIVRHCSAWMNAPHISRHPLSPPRNWSFSRLSFGISLGFIQMSIYLVSSPMEGGWEVGFRHKLTNLMLKRKMNKFYNSCRGNLVYILLCRETQPLRERDAVSAAVAA